MKKKVGSKTKTRSPSKQRRQVYKASIFQKTKLVSVRLSKELQIKYNVKKMPIRQGDSVYITSGDFLGTEGKVETVDSKNQRLIIGGIHREKADKSKILYPIHTSNTVIRKFGKMDQSRKKILERRAKKELEISDEDISITEVDTSEEE